MNSKLIASALVASSVLVFDVAAAQTPLPGKAQKPAVAEMQRPSTLVSPVLPPRPTMTPDLTRPAVSPKTLVPSTPQIRQPGDLVSERESCTATGDTGMFGCGG